MRASEYPNIKTLPLFHGMEETTFAALLRGAYVQTFPPQVELITEGDRADFLHIVLDGVVELFARTHRRETTMATVGTDSTFILAATIKDAPYLMSARTLAKSRIALLPSEDVRDAFGRDAAFARAIVSELALRYRVVVKGMKDLKLRTAVERLANHLLAERARIGRDEFELALEKKRLASLLGMTAENLSRALRSLNKYGVVVDGARVRLTDPPDLERLAKPNPLIDDPAI